MNNKVVLAFSGGLDTSYCLTYLKEKGFDVYTAYINTGGIDETGLLKVEQKALSLGAKKHFNVDAQNNFFEKVIQYIIKFNALYEDDYPLLCSDRYVIAEEIINIAKDLQADSVAHGCTNIGNDQVRFDAALTYLNHQINIIKPIKENNITRDEEMKYLSDKGIDIEFKYSKYSINENILGCTISGSEIDQNEAPAPEAYQWTSYKNGSVPETEKCELTIEFRDGKPVGLGVGNLNNEVSERLKLSEYYQTNGTEILKALNKIGSGYAVGRDIYSGDCIIGIKGRILFEAPGIFMLMKAWRKLTQYVLTKQQLAFFKSCSEKWTELVYSGLYYEPLCRNLEAMIDNAFIGITGTVTVVLKINSIEIVKVETKQSLFNHSLATYAQRANWTNKESDGFIKLFTLQQNITSMI